MFRNYESSSIRIIGGRIMNQLEKLEIQRKVLRQAYANLPHTECRTRVTRRQRIKKQDVIKEFHFKSILSER
jgi:hypothetical protein